MNKHISTPWRLGRPDITSYDGLSGVKIKYIYTNNEDERICVQGRNCIINARHIVKCVNMHDELISSLKDIVSKYDEMLDRYKPYKFGRIENARRLIAESEQA